MSGRQYANLNLLKDVDRREAALPANERLLFTLIIRDERMTRAGLLTITCRRWASMVPGWTSADVEGYIDGISEEGLCLVDWEQEQLLLPSFLTTDRSLRNAMHALSVLAALQAVPAEAFRVALAEVLASMPDEMIARPSERASEKTIAHAMEVRSLIRDWQIRTLGATQSATSSATSGEAQVAHLVAFEQTETKTKTKTENKTETKGVAPVAGAPSPPSSQSPAVEVVAEEDFEGLAQETLVSAVIRHAVDALKAAGRTALSDRDKARLANVLNNLIDDGHSEEKVRAAVRAWVREICDRSRRTVKPDHITMIVADIDDKVRTLPDGHWAPRATNGRSSSAYADVPDTLDDILGDRS